MDIEFHNRVKKQCRNPRGKLKLRLDSILASDNLAVLKSLYGHCHALKGNRKGQWALNLDNPYRLIFEPIDDPLPKSENGWINLEKITTVRILEIGDYHD